MVVKHPVVLGGVWAQRTVPGIHFPLKYFTTEHYLSILLDVVHGLLAHNIVKPDVLLPTEVRMGGIYILPLNALQDFHYITGFNSFPFCTRRGIILRNSRHPSVPEHLVPMLDLLQVPTPLQILEKLLTVCRFPLAG